jgi:hypothetical protein
LTPVYLPTANGGNAAISLKNAVFSDAVLPPSFNGKGIDE